MTKKPNDSCLQLLLGTTGLLITSSNGRTLAQGIDRVRYSKQLNWLIAKLHAVPESCGQDTSAHVTLKFFRHGSRLGTCVAIVQCAVSVAASSSTGASSGTAAAVVVVSSHSIGSGLRVIARASTSSMRETGTM